MNPATIAAALDEIRANPLMLAKLAIADKHGDKCEIGEIVSRHIKAAREEMRQEGL